MTVPIAIRISAGSRAALGRWGTSECGSRPTSGRCGDRAVSHRMSHLQRSGGDTGEETDPRSPPAAPPPSRPRTHRPRMSHGSSSPSTHRVSLGEQAGCSPAQPGLPSFSCLLSSLLPCPTCLQYLSLSRPFREIQFAPPPCPAPVGTPLAARTVGCSGDKGVSCPRGCRDAG